MTNHLPGDHLPSGAPWLIPTEAQCGHGYINETGEDAIVVAMICGVTGPVNVAFRPDIAMQLSAMLATQCIKLRRLTTDATTQPDTDEGDELKMTMTNRASDPAPARIADPEIARIIEGVQLTGCAPNLMDIKTLLASTDPWAQWWSRGLPEVLQESIDAAVNAANNV
jgi:hypothetical protein